MFTNTYTPHVGGVAKSVQAFTQEFRKLGHRVLVIAPEFPNMPEDEVGVLRIPAIQNFNGSDFSVKLPVSPELYKSINQFDPDIVHSHHPFLLGDTALRVAISRDVPIVFTHHTMYERYTHYVPGDSEQLKRFAMELATGYANLCNAVIAPSESIKQVIVERGVKTPVFPIPTGVSFAEESTGNNTAFREKYGIPPDAFLIGHVGRIAPEKNLVFLSRAIKQFMRSEPTSYALIVGDGSFLEELKGRFRARRFKDRVIFSGTLTGGDLKGAYEAMNVFAFSSHTETQGMVVLEAMAAGVPVVGLDAPGVREVIKNKVNGRLIMRESSKSFKEGLQWVHDLDARILEAVKSRAIETAKDLSIENCSLKVLEVYENQAKQSAGKPQLEKSLWDSARRRLEVEWDIFSSRARAFRLALALKGYVTSKLAPFFRVIRKKLQQFFSRNELEIKWLKLSRPGSEAESAGLVMVQIDGLSHEQLGVALESGKMPFLAKLIGQKGYKNYSFYSGVPSTTPAVQAELFYGEKTAVPAFKFLDRQSGAMAIMFDPASAWKVEGRIKKVGEGLLAGGSSYSNIYSGGAEEVHFCPSAAGWESVWHAINPIRLSWLIAFHARSILRVIGLAIVEAVLAVFDCVKGLVDGRELFKELKFVPSRVAICVILREFITIGAGLDATRGLPIIHANFLGYDEQAHRRGPRSRFAHWTLKGIDDAIKRIYRAAEKSKRRSYKVIVYSDHGQESTVSYFKKRGTEVAEEVARIFEGVDVEKKDSRPYESGHQLFRSSWLGGGLLQKALAKPEYSAFTIREDMQIAAMGPIGHIYADLKVHELSRKELAARLSREAGIPMVLTVENDKVYAFTSESDYSLPEDGPVLVGVDHPFMAEVIDDLISLTKHENAGDFVIIGWNKESSPITFATENGSHGGPGSEETHGFVLLPSDVSSSAEAKSYLRAMDLRHIALQILGRQSKPNRFKAQYEHSEKEHSEKSLSL